MENEIKIISDQIFTLVEKNLTLSREKCNGAPEEIIKRTTLQAGIIDEIGIEYKQKGIYGEM